MHLNLKLYLLKVNNFSKSTRYINTNFKKKVADLIAKLTLYCYVIRNLIFLELPMLIGLGIGFPFGVFLSRYIIQALPVDSVNLFFTTFILLLIFFLKK